MKHALRYLGFAFANADFLFEVDPRGTVVFTAGAFHGHAPENSLAGSPAAALFPADYRPEFQSLLAGLAPGARSGPHAVLLADGGTAALSLFKLPENGGNISCTLNHGRAKRAATGGDATRFAQSRDRLLAEAAKAGAATSLSLLSIPDLPGICAGLPAENADALLKRIGAQISAGGATQSEQISGTSFGALAPATLGHLDLAAKVAKAFADENLPPPPSRETRIGLDGKDMSLEQRLLALRYVIDQFSEKKTLTLARADIGAAFASMVETTQRRLREMSERLDQGAFEIAYQPIKDLKSGEVSHYEALARFNTPEGTGDTVKFIESLGVSNAFDLAVANKVLSVIAQRTDVHIAFNVSGATIASSPSFALLAGLLEKHRKIAPRALIEITETVGIQDLAAAGKAIAALRGMGYRVGLDDFGAGAASINYLHAFQVDFVKFDGAMIKKIGKSAREDALLAGMAKLCEEMDLDTIAEWIEDEAMAKAARAMGFRHGQGKWLGSPLLEIPHATRINARREGVKESWG